MRLSGKTVIVTGGAGAIGTQVCQSSLNEGANVVASDLSEQALERLTERLGDTGGSFMAMSGDGSDFRSTEQLVTSASARFDGIDAVVNVAGVFTVEDFVDSSRASWSAALNANLYTAVSMCRAAAPGMIARGSGSIVNFASTAGEFGSIRPAAAYAAAKGAIIAFSKSLAREISPLGVRVNCVSPGPIDTAMFATEGSGDVAAGGGAQTGASRTLVGRMGTPLDIANGVVYLASDESGFVTGTVLRINGGSLI